MITKDLTEKGIAHPPRWMVPQVQYETYMVITDFGNTINWLMNLGIKVQEPSDLELVKQAIGLYNVEIKGAELRIVGLSLANLYNGIIRLAQACLRVCLVATASILPSNGENSYGK